jgi:hypothetical protein
METLHVMSGADDREGFARGLRHLKERTAWSLDEWAFGDERRRWNGLQMFRQIFGNSRSISCKG